MAGPAPHGTSLRDAAGRVYRGPQSQTPLHPLSLASGHAYCVDCGEPATHYGLSVEPSCLPCAVSAMAYGHKHSHDEPEDCVATLETLDEMGTVEICCPEPILPYGDDDNDWDGDLDGPAWADA